MKTESKIQQEIVRWFRNNYCLKHSVPRCAIFSVPNERKDTRELMKMKATGLMAGVSDLIVVIPSKVLFIEVKDDKGRQSEKQKYFEETMKGLSLEYHLVRSLDDFKTLLNKNVIN